MRAAGYWIITALALIFWAFSALDLYFTLSNNEAYLADFPPEMVAWIQAFPLWRRLLWGGTIALGLAGAVALLFRRRIAATLLALGFLGMAIGFFLVDLLLGDGMAYYGEFGIVASIVIISLAGAFAFYSSLASRRGELR